MVGLYDARLPDPAAEKVRANHHGAIQELQRLPSSALRLITNVTLEDGVETPISHGLGRRCTVFISPPRGASSTGRIEESRSSGVDQTKYVALTASGWGATITVDLMVL